LADKITNIEDYRKRDVKQNIDEKPEPIKEQRPKEPVTQDTQIGKPVTQETMEIEIEDPFKFLNEEEREEYIHERQKAEEAEQHGEDADDEYDEEEYDDEEYSDEEESGRGVNMELVVRIASIITGIVILLFIAMVVKTKVFDRYLAKDPDEVQTVVSAVPAGFTEKNDTVVVSGASSLNLRSGPDTSSTIITAVNEGTELKRIALAEDGHWALVEYEGQQVYASMKYLKEK
jgi:uncharacterized protein YgiM (DUF1202 family)